MKHLMHFLFFFCIKDDSKANSDKFAKHKTLSLAKSER